MFCTYMYIAASQKETLLSPSLQLSDRYKYSLLTVYDDKEPFVIDETFQHFIQVQLKHFLNQLLKYQEAGSYFNNCLIPFDGISHCFVCLKKCEIVTFIHNASWQ